MGALKLMKAVESVSKELSTEDIDLVSAFVITDPMKITHSINFWDERSRKTGISAEEQARCTKIVNALTDYYERQCMFTCNVYSFEENEEKKQPEKKNEVKENNKDEKNNAVRTPEEKKKIIIEATVVKDKSTDPSVKNLHVVKDALEEIPGDKDRILRVKYAKLIKQINFDGLKALLTQNYKENKEADAIELATFILSQGLYLGTKVKNWKQEAIDKFLEGIKKETSTTKAPVQTVEQKKEETKETKEVKTEPKAEDKPAEDVDLFKKYAAYIGKKAPTMGGLRAQTLCDLKENKDDASVSEAMELATFMLMEGFCADDQKKYSNSEIEDWFKSIKTEIETGVKVEPVKTYDTALFTFNLDVKDQILKNNLDEKAIKEYIFDKVKTTKIECLEKYFNGTETQEEREDMYGRYFLSYVSEQFKQKADMAIDVHAEITKLVAREVEKGSKTLGNVVNPAMMLYKRKGETVSAKEVKEIVDKIAETNHAEFYAIMVAAQNKDKKDEKVTVVEGTVDFVKQYPEAWESIKDTNPESLDDVFNMAKNLEVTQAFPIVLAAITHFISSGKIKNAINKDKSTWTQAQIELWVNSMFKNEETPAEKEEKVNPTQPAKELQEVKPGAGQETVENAPSTEKELEVAPKTTEELQPGNSIPSKEIESTGKENTDKVGEATAASPEKKESQDSIAAGQTEKEAGSNSATDVLNMKHLGDFVIPEEHKEFTALYAKQNDSAGFHNGLKVIIDNMMTEGKSKKDITHELADVLKAIAINDKLTQTFARNFRKTSMQELYKTIDAKALKLEIKGWKELKEE